MNLSIAQRAKRVSELCSQLLIEDEGDEVQVEAYRFTYLVLRGPKSFRHTFQAGSLYLDRGKIQDACWAWRFDIPGARGLTQEEVRMIDYHNEMVLTLSQ